MNANKLFSTKKLVGFGALAAVLAFGSPAQAQKDDTEPRFGIKGGINVSNLYVSEVNDQKSKFGVHGGVWAKLPVSPLFAIQPEAIFSTAGSKISGYTATAGPQNQAIFNLNYIQVPVLASLTLGPVSVQAGPYFSYLLSAKVKNIQVDNNGVPTQSSDGRELNKDDFNTVDYGLAGGLALDIKGFQLGARYNYGLRNVGQKAIANTLTNNSKNSVAQVFIAVGF